MTKPSKEELQEKYKELKSTIKVGEFYKVSQRTALNWLEDYGIERRKSNQQISKENKPSKEELKSIYHQLGSTRKIAEHYKRCFGTIQNWMEDYEIERKKSSKQISIEKKPSKEELERMLAKLKTDAKVGMYYGVDRKTVSNWREDYDIRKIRPSKKELEAKYKELGSTMKLGEYYKVSQRTALNWMEKAGIETMKSNQQISQEKKPSKEELKAKCKELGYNAVKVGEYYKVDPTTSWKWMKKAGFITNRSDSLESQIQAYIGMQGAGK
jgi:hypothetical protein